jgi:hypothetical protein
LYSNVDVSQPEWMKQLFELGQREEEEIAIKPDRGFATLPKKRNIKLQAILVH